jgi:hypothetical protein
MFLKARLDPQDPWAHSVAVFLKDGLPQPSFTGSCCEFRVKLRSISKLSKPGCMQVQAPSQALSQVPSYDGYLLYPQYNLLVDSNFNAIDIFALGKQQGLDPGVLHGVVQPEDAFNYQQEGVVASGSGLLVLDSFELTLEFSNPMNGGATEKVLVKVIIINRNTEVECDKGSHPTAADIQKSGTCTGQTNDSHHQATIILGNPANKNGGAGYYLLLTRLYTWEIKLSKKGDDALYDHLQSKLKNGGFEGHQLGGSGGKVEVNKNLLTFLHHPRIFPTKGKGIKFVPHGNTWNCFYVWPYKRPRTVVQVSYSQPQKGGSMCLTTADTAAFPYLGTFAESKPFAALLLQALNHQVLRTYKTGQLCYPPPISKEFKHLSLAEAQCTRSKSDLLDALVLLNKHTLVAYAVGYHIDVFADDEPSLENCICFLHSKKGEATSEPAQGRGGGGAGIFCWALLDWTQKRQKRPARFHNIQQVQYTS